MRERNRQEQLKVSIELRLHEIIKVLFQLKEQQRLRYYEIQRAEYLKMLREQQTLLVCLRKIVQEIIYSFALTFSFIRNIKLKPEQQER